MLKITFIACFFFWTLILIYLIQRRGYLILLIWLLVAPVITNLIVLPGHNPFIRPPKVEIAKWPPDYYNLQMASTITLQDLLEPNRIIISTDIGVFILGAIFYRRRLGPFERIEIFMGIFSFIVVASAILQSTRPWFGLHIASDAFIIPFLF